jgi:hypothetical protein
MRCSLMHVPQSYPCFSLSSSRKYKRVKHTFRRRMNSDYHLIMRWWKQPCSLTNPSCKGRNVSRGKTSHHRNASEVSASHSSHLYHWRISLAPVKLNNHYGRDSEEIICIVTTRKRTEMCSSTWQINIPLNFQIRMQDELVSNLCRVTCYLDRCFHVFSQSTQPNRRIVLYDCLLICTSFMIIFHLTR